MAISERRKVMVKDRKMADAMRDLMPGVEVVINPEIIDPDIYFVLVESTDADEPRPS